MNNYEFWDELGNIFDAVLAYQKKTVEFNNRFITPWIRLGNVFDRQDRNKDAVEGFQKATEIDPENVQNWIDLGDSYFKTGAYEDAANSYEKAIVLDPRAGWPLSNLALSLASQGKLQEAIPLYTKSLELFTDNEDKAICWNRLGNAYRKLNDYDNAMRAFQQADDLDSENTGFCDQLDEASDAPSVLVDPVETAVASLPETPEHDVELPVNAEGTASVQKLEAAVAAKATIDLPSETSTPIVQPEMIEAENEVVVPSVKSVDAGVQEMTPVSKDKSASSFVEDETIKTITMAFLDLVETYSSDDANVVGTGSAVDDSKEQLPVENTEQTHENPVVPTSDSDAVANPAAIEDKVVSENESVSEFVSIEDADANLIQAEVWDERSEEVKLVVEAEQNPAQNVPAIDEVVVAVTEQNSTNEAAYEEYLNDTITPVKLLSVCSEEMAQEAVDQKPVAQISDSGDVKIEMDTKNAHVWNELGNVYFNSGNYDDAISAYSKAVELDRQFAWSYSNLALAYVQKSRFAEAVLLYQRSIELFTNDKDKAITWNRLGNVYRRQGDYYNAIAAYQTADELDPNNSTLSLRSRFSLLGNFYVEQIPNSVS